MVNISQNGLRFFVSGRMGRLNNLCQGLFFSFEKRTVIPRNNRIQEIIYYYNNIAILH